MTGKVQSFSNTLKKLAGIIGLAFGTAAIINFGKESVRAATESSNAWMGLQSILDGQGKSFSKAKSFIDDYISDGLVPLNDAVTAYKNLAARGYSTEQIEKVMTALKDASAFNRQASYTMGEAVSSATEGLKNENSILVDNAGVTKNVAKMWQDYANELGISYTALTQEQKIQAEVNGILEETRFQTGDAAKLAGTYSGQISQLSVAFTDLKVAVGNAIMPIVQAVLPGINAIISALIKLANVFAQVTALLFGKSAQMTATDGIASSAGTAADATDNLAEATEGAGNASESAAKKMKGVLAGFDELNVLADSASSSLDSAAGGLDIGDIDAEIPDELDLDGGALEEMGEKFKSLGEIFRDTLDDMLAGIPKLRDAFLDFAERFNNFNQTLYDAFKFDGVLERVEQLGRDLAQAFNDLVNAIDWELWGRTLGAGLNLGLQFLTEFIYTFDWVNLGQKLADFINGLVYEVDWYDFGRLLWAQFKIALETFAGFITGLDMPALAKAASDTIMGFFDEMKNTIDKIEWGEIGKQIAEFLNNIDWIGVITSIAGALESMVSAGLELVGGFIANADPDTLLIAAAFLGTKLLGGLIGKVVSPIAKEVASNLIKKIAESITSSGISSLLSSVGSAISKIAVPLAGIGSVIGGVVTAVTSFFSMWNEGFSWAKEAVMLVGIALTAVGAILLGVPALVAAIVAGIVAAVATAAVVIHEHWDEIKEFAIGAFESIKEAWSNAGEWFDTNVIQPVAEFFSGLWEDIKTLAYDTWQAVQEAWAAASAWFGENVIEPVKEFFADLWESIATLASETWSKVQEVWNVVSTWFNDNVIGPVKTFFDEMWENICQLSSEAWEAIKNAWSAAGEWFRSTITEPIMKFFGEAWDKIKTSASEAWENIKNGVQNFWNELKSWWSSNVGKYFTAEYWKDLGKRMVDGLLDGLKNIFSGLTSWASDVWSSVTGAFSAQKAKSSISSGINYAPRMASAEYAAYSARDLPRLANGAVIPPNQQFAAILGDQRSGKNIEAPLATIEQALQNVMNRNMNGGYAGDMTVILQVNETELGRVVYRLNNKETQRVGVRLTEVRT